MREPQVDRPDISTAPLSQGLGWLMAQWDGKNVVGHGGGTIGQLSFLQVLPDNELVVVLLTNSGTGGLQWRDLGRWLFDELAGVQMPGPLKVSDSPPALSLERYVGTYERLGVRNRVAVEEGELVVHTELSGPLAELQQGVPQPPARLRPIDAERFATTLYGEDATVAFLEFARGRPRYLFTGRVARRARARRSV